MEQLLNKFSIPGCQSAHWCEACRGIAGAAALRGIRTNLGVLGAGSAANATCFLNWYLIIEDGLNCPVIRSSDQNRHSRTTLNDVVCVGFGLRLQSCAFRCFPSGCWNPYHAPSSGQLIRPAPSTGVWMAEEIQRRLQITCSMLYNLRKPSTTRKLQSEPATYSWKA